MSLPGHRRTSSHKRRRASHFALKPLTLSQDSAGRSHRPHRLAPGAVEYRGIPIHIKGQAKKLAKMVQKTQPHDHSDHDHSGPDHQHDHQH